MRITDDLAGMLRRHAPLFVVTHFNHPKECTEEAQQACERLVDRGVPVENQTVLLRGVNDDASTLEALFRGSGMANLMLRSTSRNTDPGDGYATIGAGTRTTGGGLDGEVVGANERYAGADGAVLFARRTGQIGRAHV